MELPELPEPASKPPMMPTGAIGAVGYQKPVNISLQANAGYVGPLFTADQMRAYALEAVRADRERASAKLDEFDAWLKSTDDDPAGWAVRQRFNDLAAAIRAQGSKT